MKFNKFSISPNLEVVEYYKYRTAIVSPILFSLKGRDDKFEEWLLEKLQKFDPNIAHIDNHTVIVMSTSTYSPFIAIMYTDGIIHIGTSINIHPW